MPDISKTERQLDLIAELLHAIRPLSLSQISEKVTGYRGLSTAASRRKFIRDREELQEKGIHIQMHEIPNTDPSAWGYIILEADYYLKDINLTPEERAAVNLTLATINISPESAQSAIYKLGGYEQFDSAQESHSENMIWLDYNKKELQQIISAIYFKKILKFKYISEAGEPTDREVEPWRVYFLQNYWHLQGYDRLRQSERIFRINRIQGEIDSVKDNSSWQPVGNAAKKMQPWEYSEKDEKPLRAELWVDSNNAEWVARQVGSSAESSQDKDGARVFKLTVNSPRRFYRFVAGFLDSAEIRGARELRDGFVEYLKDLKNV